MNTSTINLIPKATRRSLEIRQLVKIWASFVGVAVIACSIIGAIAEHRLRVQQQRNEFLVSKCAPTEALMQSTIALSSNQQRLNDIQDSLQSLVPSDDLLQTLGAVSQATKTSTEQNLARLRSLRISIHNATLPGVSEIKSATRPTAAHINMQIVGNDDLQIQECLENLRKHPRIRELRILTSSQELGSQQHQMEVEAFVYVSKVVPL